MRFDKAFCGQVNTRVQAEGFAYPERLKKVLKLTEECAGEANLPLVIAIDGRAASGKSTLAEQLSKLLDADIIHMDDFFLPPELRTEERLAEAGGNVHYERFCEEVLPNINLPAAFSYRIFDCSRMAYNGTRVIENTRIRIVEGSYSHHPKFGEYADLLVFSDVEAEEQMHRIRLRNGEEKAKSFAGKWIPMEERYFMAYDTRKNADLII